MKKHLFPFLVLGVLVIVGFTCPTNPARLNFVNVKEPGIWEYLEDANCDLDSDEAYEYLNCMFNIFEQWDNDFELHTDECDDDYAKIPGCNLSLPNSGTTTFECDVSHDQEGTYNEEHCPLERSVEMRIIIDWANRRFTYDYNWSCVRATWGFAYDYIRTEAGSTTGGGDVTDMGWLLGQYIETDTRSWVCGPPRYCGNTGTAPETETNSYTRYVVGRFASMSHLEMGLQNQEYPMDTETLSSFSSWAELEAAWRGSKSWDCYAGN